ncbi:DNA-binding protein [Cupriavidus metallidurans]|uniref:DNA-binding protein n=1 Tax=Cupriavidus metallidurans TaxID=119219 RepID=UPI001BFC756E|nr:DNA-binding protein [Cupriavidus metallidurans]QWC87779.1 DNA-binding protein [Cupriavidus metallidurans]
MPARHVEIPPGLAARANGRDTLPTNEAAAAINRKPNTLYKWSAYESGPIRPVRINGYLEWRVLELAKLLNGES